MTILAMKTKKTGLIPDPDKITDEVTKKFSKDLIDSLQMSNKDLYDDITYLFSKAVSFEDGDLWEVSGGEHRLKTADEINMRSKNITALLDPTSDQHAATKKYHDDNSFWEVDGTEHQLKTADEIDMQSKKILNVTDPVSDQDAATKKYVDDNVGTTLSNVVFTWSGVDNYTVDVHGAYVGTSQQAEYNTISGYHYCMVFQTTYKTILNFKFKKIAGVDTITIYARVWADNLNANEEAILNVDIGGASNTVKSVTSTTPSWVTASDIDVSGLEDGAVFDGIIQLKSEANQVAYCSAVTLVAS